MLIFGLSAKNRNLNCPNYCALFTRLCLILLLLLSYQRKNNYFFTWDCEASGHRVPLRYWVCLRIVCSPHYCWTRHLMTNPAGHPEKNGFSSKCIEVNVKVYWSFITFLLIPFVNYLVAWFIQNYLLTVLPHVQLISGHFKPIQMEGLFWKCELLASALLQTQRYRLGSCSELCYFTELTSRTRQWAEY